MVTLQMYLTTSVVHNLGNAANNGQTFSQVQAHELRAVAWEAQGIAI